MRKVAEFPISLGSPRKKFCAAQARCSARDLGTAIEVGPDGEEMGPLIVYNDGVTIAKEFDLTSFDMDQP